MALTTKTIPIGNDWTLVTNDVSAMVFNDIMEVFITHSTTPPASTDQGYKVAPGTPYKNCSTNISVYAKMLPSSVGIKSVSLIGEA